MSACRPHHRHGWAPVRRKFMDALESGYREANEPLKMIRELYETKGVSMM